MNPIKTLCALMLTATLIGCGERQEVPEDPSVVMGEVLFQENCAACHPRTGRGDYLKRIPVTLLKRKTQQELMAWIRGKDQHREMPSFENLSDEKRQALANYLHSQLMK
ncbi:c-type cytochrome [Porticoccus sp.]|uniref:c-type cytochrome n=1 Tax=Porticoccus sp. TaxID=2024853 RepID=UPI003F69F2DC